MQAKVKSAHSHEAMKSIRETLAIAQAKHDKWEKISTLESASFEPQSFEELQRQCLLVSQIRAIGSIGESAKVIAGMVESINHNLLANKLPVRPVNLASLHILIKGLEDVLFQSKAARIKLKDSTNKEDEVLNNGYFENKSRG